MKYYNSKSDLEAMVSRDENILWRRKPDFKCFILESIFNPLFPFALLWAIIDFSIMGVMIVSKAEGAFPVMIFFVLHLMPVWMYLGGILLMFQKYKNTEYIITDKGIYVSGGAISYTNQMKPFAELSHISIHRGIFDQMLGVGDVVFFCAHNLYSGNSIHSGRLVISDIPDYKRVFSMVKELQEDIYPNDLRPVENHGYQTKYVKKFW